MKISSFLIVAFLGAGCALAQAPAPRPTTLPPAAAPAPPQPEAREQPQPAAALRLRIRLMRQDLKQEGRVARAKEREWEEEVRYQILQQRINAELAVAAARASE